MAPPEGDGWMELNEVPPKPGQKALVHIFRDGSRRLLFSTLLPGTRVYKRYTIVEFQGSFDWVEETFIDYEPPTGQVDLSAFQQWQAGFPEEPPASDQPQELTQPDEPPE